ncbi:MAG: hypothetical protein XD76_0050 [candidate division TA06 bacterium 32_111]|uniref:Organic solvent tolerance-like N-terminal domain-containing protein n=2 Tax=Bacteria candidate phyla TaxID=1783234 RepID=A0A117M771_UNCT6|nr:MAG: hypothetical protein XD76_0050 [candidate division TA06 bacterium 32_111]KUK88134.1 MAG: hypothetical protein XE03_0140 [candidate division TA06 bacterium 34_109]
MMKKDKILILILFFFSPEIFFAYTLYSEKASIIGDTIFFFKNVDFKSDGYSLKTDSSFILKKDSLIFFPKSFILKRDDSVKILAKYGIYLIKEKRFYINFQTTEKENRFSIQSETLEIFLDDSLFIFTGKPVFDNADEKLKIFGERVEYLKNLERIYFKGNSFLQKYDSSYSIISGNILIDDKDSVNIFSSGVEIFNDSFTIKSDSVNHYRKGSFFKTLKRGDIVAKNSFFQGDTFIFYFENDSLRRMVGKNNIVFKNEDDNIVKIVCDSLDGTFKSSKVDILKFYKIKESELLKKEKDGTEK